MFKRNEETERRIKELEDRVKRLELMMYQHCGLLEPRGN